MTVTAADVRSVVRAPRVSVGHAWRYWLRNAAIFKHTYKLSLLAWFIEPVIYLVAMGLGLGHYLKAVRAHGHVFQYIDFIAPGLVALSVMYGSTFETTWNAFFKMERGKVYDAAASTPVGLEDIALGEALWATTRAMIYGGAFIVIALPFRVFHSWDGILVPVALALVGFMFAVMGLLFTYAISMVDYLSYYWTLFLTPMFMFSGIFFPLDQLPGWLQGLSWFMPLRHAVDLMRALLTEGDLAAASRASLWIVVVTAALFVLPLNLLRRRLEN
jgi:lipooligosaccharide transport system permease protein